MSRDSSVSTVTRLLAG